MLVSVYTAVGYFVGVLLHECGKLIVERSKYFETSAVKKLAYNGESVCRGVFWRINLEYKKAIENAILDDRVYKLMNFESAMSYLKYIDEKGTKRIDKYHSVYALARSLSIGFSVHAIVEIGYSLIVNGNVSVASLAFAAVDTVFAWVLWKRAYRYFCGWVKNIFIQYSLRRPA